MFFLVSCDVINNCHPFANCEFDQNVYRYQCVCAPGYDGNGIDCIEIEANCAHEDICDVHADCIYNGTLRKNLCLCHAGYDGNGKSCQLAAECSTSADCGYHSVCVEGICECSSGFERDTSDL
jgi:nidogen (entactin)